MVTSKAERDERRTKALALRRAGAQYADIAKVLGVSTGTAWKDVTSALRETMTEEATALRTLQGQRLDALLRGLYPQAIAGDTKAALAAVRIMERQSRLFGLDAPAALTMSVEYRDAYEAEFARIAARLGAEPR